jgi:hypothetical protein
VADDVEVAVERSQAVRQLCAHVPDDGTSLRHPPAAADGPSPAPVSETCDEQQLYRCAAGAVIDCTAHVIAASCERGCISDGAFIDDRFAPLQREAAFAILCSR